MPVIGQLIYLPNTVLNIVYSCAENLNKQLQVLYDFDVKPGFHISDSAFLPGQP